MGHRFCGMVFCNVIIVFLVMDMQCKSKNNFVSNIDKCKQIEKKQQKTKQTNTNKQNKKIQKKTLNTPKNNNNIPNFRMKINSKLKYWCSGICL